MESGLGCGRSWGRGKFFAVEQDDEEAEEPENAENADEEAVAA